MNGFYLANQTAVPIMTLAPEGKETLAVAVALVRANDDRTIRVGEAVFAHARSVVANAVVATVRIRHARNKVAVLPHPAVLALAGADFCPVSVTVHLSVRGLDDPVPVATAERC